MVGLGDLKQTLGVAGGSQPKAAPCDTMPSSILEGGIDEKAIARRHRTHCASGTSDGGRHGGKGEASTASSPPDWSGFYLGVHGGYGWKKDPFSSSECVFFCGKRIAVEALNGNGLVSPQHIVIDGINPKGGVFGAHAGYNWQYGSVVTGFEFDLSFTNIKGSTTGSASHDFIEFICIACLVPPQQIDRQTITHTEERRVKYLGTARARLGWVPVNWLLLYGTAGLAWEQLERTHTETFTSSLFPIDNSTNSFTDIFDKFGWVAGVGGEVKLFGSNVIGRLEYLHYDFGPVVGSSSFPPSFEVRSGHQRIDVVRAGLSYKFQNGPGYY